MKKDGFIFMESLTVLIVVLLATTMLLSSYSLYVRKSKERENYNLPSDRFLLYNIATIGDYDYGYYNGPGFIANRREYNENLNPNGCTNTPLNEIMGDCQQLFMDNNLVYFIVIPNIVTELKKSNITSIYDSGTIEYLKTLKKSRSSYYEGYDEDNDSAEGYIVGVFYRNNAYHYASIPLYYGG